MHGTCMGYAWDMRYTIVACRPDQITEEQAAKAESTDQAGRLYQAEL